MSALHAPIALFVYNRPWHTRRAIQALAENHGAGDSSLYIFSDAPQNAHGAAGVEEVRECIAHVDGFKSVHIVEREFNHGLAKSVIDGVSRLCETHGRVIVVEDDLLTSPYFLKYMNDALNLYAGDERVCCISGYMYPVELDSADGTLLLNFPMSWGWATWRRAWGLFEEDGRALMAGLNERGLMASFDRIGAGSFAKMLQDQVEGRNDSWFIRWHASLYLNGRLSLAPTQSLVNNIGLDGTGVHCSKWLLDPYNVEPLQKPIDVSMQPQVFDDRFPDALRWFFRRARILRYVNAILRIVLDANARRGAKAGGKSR